MDHAFRPLTDCLTSGFWSPRGLTTEAPVFSSQPRLPTLLGQFVWTSGLFWLAFGLDQLIQSPFRYEMHAIRCRDIPLADRATMLPFLYSVLDYDRDSKTYESYDRMTAKELFDRCSTYPIREIQRRE